MYVQSSSVSCAVDSYECDWPGRSRTSGTTARVVDVARMGNENWQSNDDCLMASCFASINDLSMVESDRPRDDELCLNDLATATGREVAAHGEHEKRNGKGDTNWPDWYVAYTAAEQAGTEPPM